MNTNTQTANLLNSVGFLKSFQKENDSETKAKHQKKLIERYRNMPSGKHKLVHTESSECDHLRDCETPYYTIEPVDVV